MEYANFDLRLAGAAGSYTAEVLDSPAGQTPAPARISCDPAAGIPASESLEGLRTAGRALWRCAFGDRGISELWRGSLAAAGAQGGLRLRLMIDAPGLAALPWELLYDETLDRFLALDGRTPVVRFVRLPFAPSRRPAGRPLRLLFTGASPARLAPLDLAAAWEGVTRELSEVATHGRPAPSVARSGATISDLADALQQGVDIWHYVGHGVEGRLAFEDGRGGAAAADAPRLGALLAGEGVRLAVLNACHSAQGGGEASSVAEALVKADVPAVVAMQGEPFESVARAFARGFYAAIAAGQGVDRAVTAGRKAILALLEPREGSWWLPALFMRTPDGRLWQTEGAMAEEKPRAGRTMHGDEIHAAGPVAPRGSAVSIGSGVAFVGDGNVVITGKVGGDVIVGGQPPPAPPAGGADFLRLVAGIRRDLAALAPGALADDDRADALDALDKVSAQAGRVPPPGERISQGCRACRRSSTQPREARRPWSSWPRRSSVHGSWRSVFSGEAARMQCGRIMHNP